MLNSTLNKLQLQEMNVLIIITVSAIYSILSLKRDFYWRFWSLWLLFFSRFFCFSNRYLDEYIYLWRRILLHTQIINWTVFSEFDLVQFIVGWSLFFSYILQVDFVHFIFLNRLENLQSNDDDGFDLNLSFKKNAHNILVIDLERFGTFDWLQYEK